MERLGLGPEPCLQRNPKLVYGRITGWGQSGPLAQAAGHDINYIALTGALHAIGTAGKPVAPLNLVGDFGGGAMFVAFGIVCALLEAGKSGRGQVVDAAMTDGAALLMAMQYSFKAMGHWKNEREANLLDGGAPFYGTYECADGKWLALGPIEPPFHDLLVAKLDLPADEFAERWDPASWPRLHKRLADTLRTRTRAQWCEAAGGPTLAWRRCSIWTRRRGTRTTSPDRPSWSTRASFSRRRRRGSRAPRQKSSARPPNRASMATKS
jgi:alpha-methylacyl-CoA racemase